MSKDSSPNRVRLKGDDPAAEAFRPTAEGLIQALQSVANAEQAKILRSFFKTGPGQYGEGDVFIGVKVPSIRKLVRQFRNLSPTEARKLVRSPIHEARLAGLLLWVQAYEKGTPQSRCQIFELYLGHTKYINNWDLVDLSAPHIVGRSVNPQEAAVLDSLAGSGLLWERRIAVVATFAYIRQGIFEPTLRLCRQLLPERHDLMHKACGWMLREIGKRDRAILSRFLDQHAKVMPRTMLRYALEHYCSEERQKYMAR